ncbi:MAG: matrixin family metalloprotease, partial [Romboutsia sp.]|nr:matrixin family metalloprotease [Romboutsia sp.]
MYLLLIVFLSCNNKKDNNSYYLDNSYMCSNREDSDTDSYQLAAGRITGNTFNYYIDDDRIDKDLIGSTMIEFYRNSNVLGKYTSDKNNADVIIKVGEIDGLGGTLAKAWYPSPSFVIGSNPRPMILDEEDFFGKGKDLFNHKNIILHEWGHIYGAKHSSIENSVMFWKYNKDATGLYIDDILGIRNHYGDNEDFEYRDILYRYIDRNKYNEKISNNFTYGEFLSHCDDVNHGNYIANPLIDALQLLRYEYGSITINSTFRTEACNKKIGGANQSTHQLSQAVDFSFAIGNLAFEKDIKNSKCIYYMLLELGITGIAIYDNHVHIDV